MHEIKSTPAGTLCLHHFLACSSSNPAVQIEQSLCNQQPYTWSLRCMATGLNGTCAGAR